MRLGLLCLLLSVLASFWLAERGSAQAALVTWQAPSSCPDIYAARARMAQTREAILRERGLHARITQREEEYELELSLEPRNGARPSVRMSALDCSAFIELSALELALSALAATAESEPPPPPKPQPAKHFGWGARATAIVGTGPTPSFAPGVGVALALLFQRWRLELGGNFLTPRTVRYRAPSAVGARLQLLAAEARGCHALPVRGIELPLCGGLELGVLRAAGRGVPLAFATRSLWTAVFVSQALRVPLFGPLSVWFELGAWFALLRPAYGVRNLPLLYRPAALSVRGALGIALHFD